MKVPGITSTSGWKTSRETLNYVTLIVVHSSLIFLGAGACIEYISPSNARNTWLDSCLANVVTKPFIRMILKPTLGNMSFMSVHDYAAFLGSWVHEWVQIVMNQFNNDIFSQMVNTPHTIMEPPLAWGLCQNWTLP